jgi:hypothetical protein
MIEGAQFDFLNPERFLNSVTAQIQCVLSRYFERDQNGWRNRNALKLALSQSSTRNVAALEKTGAWIGSGVKEAEAFIEATKGPCEMQRWIEPAAVFDRTGH